MANWLERAKREVGLAGMGGSPPNSQIPQGTSQATAKTAERSPTAVTAVQEPGEPEISRDSIGSNGSAPPENFQETAPAAPITVGEESAIRAWLARIGESDDTTIADVLTRCRTDAEARGYFIARSGEAPSPSGLDDDRRRCD